MKMLKSQSHWLITSCNNFLIVEYHRRAVLCPFWLLFHSTTKKHLHNYKWLSLLYNLKIISCINNFFCLNCAFSLPTNKKYWNSYVFVSMWNDLYDIKWMYWFYCSVKLLFQKTTDKRTKKRESLVIIYKKVLNISINKTVTWKLTRRLQYQKIISTTIYAVLWSPAVSL